jgi:hypothetical protein
MPTTHCIRNIMHIRMQRFLSMYDLTCKRMMQNGKKYSVGEGVEVIGFDVKALYPNTKMRL